MKKQILFGLATITALSVNAQTAKKMIPNAKIKNMQTVKTVIAEPNFVSPQPTSSPVYRTAVPAPFKRIGGSNNAFGIYAGDTDPLIYNPTLNALGLVHRATNQIWQSLGALGNTGSLVYSWSTNNGNTWDSTVLAASATRLMRFPTGAIYNPPANTTVANAYAVASGPWHPSEDWQGNYFVSKQLGTAYTATPGNALYVDNLALAGRTKQDFTRTGFQITSDGIAHVLGSLYSDINKDISTASQAAQDADLVLQGYRGVIINKGTFSAGTFTWTVDSLKPDIKARTSGAKYITTTTNMAWSENGQTGYVIFYGVDANALPNTTMNANQPLVYKTINAGGTWARHAPLFNFSSISSVTNRLLAINSTGLEKANINAGEGSSATVDAAGNLHLFASMTSCASDNIDSLNFAFSPNYNRVWNYLYDFKTTASGWDAVIIDSLSCEGPAAAESNWSGGSAPAGNLPYDARLQISRTSDGQTIFYSWADSDSLIVSGTFPHVSVAPDIYIKGYDVATNKMTCKKSPTVGKSGIAYNSYFFKASPIVAKPTSTTFLIPTLVTQSRLSVAAPYEGDKEVDYIYLNNNTFSQSEFNTNVNIAGCSVVSVKEEKLSVLSNLNFYPNPASTNGTVELALTENSKIELTVLNSVGQVVYTTSVNGVFGSNKINVDLANLSNGLYFYQVKTTNAKAITQKFVVSK